MEDLDFHHPYIPYDIQTQFMRSLYSCIEEGKVGIFESPTGTGKSLSLICGSLTWLRDNKKKTFETGLQNLEIDDDEPNWVREQIRSQKRDEARRRLNELEEKLARIRAKEKLIRENYENNEPQSKRRRIEKEKDPNASGDEDFALRDYESDGETTKPGSAVNENGLSTETLALMAKLGYSEAPKRQDDSVETVDETKIFFCSRTHSQLIQFANELNRVKMPPGIAIGSSDGGKDDTAQQTEEFKHITLGSRKNLCINSKVSKLGSATAINERCLELQQSGTTPTGKCPYCPTKETEAIVQDFRDHALAKIRDIEDLGKLGKKLDICPYYASRAAVKPCEIVTLPYPLLLQRSAREALDISLKDQVVIIDEAHNLIDSIAGIHSASVSLKQLERARSQLMLYLQKFKNRLKGKNRTYVAQTVRLLDSLIAFLKKTADAAGKTEGTVEASEMLSGKGVDQINIHKLDHYLHESKLARKVDGYISHEEEKQKEATRRGGPSGIQGEVARSTPVLMHVQAFLLALMNPSSEGQFFYSKESGEDVALKYLLLDPTHHFKEIVQEARSVILVGGTMSPMNDFIQQLFSYIPPTRIMTLSCGHVIPPSNLLALPLVQGSSNEAFDFTFEKRNSSAMIKDLGQTILDLIQHIPDGVVVFFPSYTYLDSCVSQWKQASVQAKDPQAPKTIWSALQAIKPMFLESRSQHATTTPKSAAPQSTKASTSASSTSTTTESVLAAYTAAILTPPANNPTNGALLLTVIGGSLSEGINFSDRLGRGVLVVGLPFPNAHSAEWKAKLAYITASAAKDSGGKTDGKDAAREYYENACMRAVNQSIGRAIRHKGDYAAIMMLDRRFGGRKIREKLPGWIRGSLRGEMGVGRVLGELDDFFKGKG